MTQASVKSRGPIAAHPVTSAVVAILVIAAIFFSLYVPLYAVATPKVGDFPFFYFFLLAFMPVVALALWVVTLLQRPYRDCDKLRGSASGHHFIDQRGYAHAASTIAAIGATVSVAESEEVD